MLGQQELSKGGKRMPYIQMRQKERAQSPTWRRNIIMKAVSKTLVGIALLVVATSVCAQTPTKTQAGASPRLLTPQNAVLVLIDHQPQMAFAAQSMDTQALVNNVTGLAKAAKVFKIPTILTTVASKTFSGPMFATVQAVFPEQTPIDRTTMNSWEDKRVVEAVQKTGRKKVVIAE